MPPPLSRRTVIKAAGSAVFIGASAAVLPMFSTPSRKQTPQSCPSTDLSANERELVVSNWVGYMDPPEEASSTFAAFERDTGIAVTYTEDVSDNQEFFAKVVNQLGSCQSVKRDVFVLTDYMATQVINLGWVQPLDHSRMPNVDANLLPELRNVAFDPGRTYSVPWQCGFTGIAYNAALVPEVSSFAELLKRGDLRGRITLLTEMLDTMSFMLRVVGADPQDFSHDEWESALDLLRETRSRGQIRAFTGNEYLRDLAAGNIAACLAWSGDVLQLQFENPDLRFVAPEEGLYFFSDNVLVPNLATHKANAEKWINYYYDPEVAAHLAAYIKCLCPVTGAQQAMEKVTPSLVDNPLIFPTPEFLSKSFGFMTLNETLFKRYQRDFSDAIGG
jgi:spermidine/putrescine transport system substrate-binding protein